MKWPPSAALGRCRDLCGSDELGGSVLRLEGDVYSEVDMNDDVDDGLFFL